MGYQYDKVEVPEDGEPIQVVDEDNDELEIPENPIIPIIHGDGIGRTSAPRHRKCWRQPPTPPVATSRGCASTPASPVGRSTTRTFRGHRQRHRRTPSRHQGSANDARRRRVPVAQRRAATDARFLLERPTHLLPRRRPSPMKARRGDGHGHFPGEHGGRLRRHRVGRGHRGGREGPQLRRRGDGLRRRDARRPHRHRHQSRSPSSAPSASSGRPSTTPSKHTTATRSPSSARGTS